MDKHLENTLWVIEDIQRDTDSAQQRDDIAYGCTNPGAMNEQVFERLQRLSERFEMDRAQGHDCTPGFDDHQGEVDRLMEASPWTLHPDFGIVRKDSLSSSYDPK